MKIQRLTGVYLKFDADGNASGNWLPRALTTAEADAIAGEAGEFIYITDTPGVFRVMNGTSNGGDQFASGWIGHAETWSSNQYRTIIQHHGGARVAAGVALADALQDAFDNHDRYIRIICEPGDYVVSQMASKVADASDTGDIEVTLIMHGCRLLMDATAATVTSLIEFDDATNATGRNFSLRIVGADIQGDTTLPIVQVRNGATAITVTTTFEDCRQLSTATVMYAAKVYTATSATHRLNLIGCSMYVNNQGFTTTAAEVHACPYVKLGGLTSTNLAIASRGSWVEFAGMELNATRTLTSQHCRHNGATIRADNVVTLLGCHMTGSFTDWDGEETYTARTIKAAFCTKVQDNLGTNVTNAISPDNTVYSFTL